LERRQDVLVVQGHAQRFTDGRIQYRQNLLVTLERQELKETGEKLAHARRLPLRIVQDGDRVRGIFKETVQLASGKYAHVQNSQESMLIPWRPVIDKALGKEITGAVRGDSISWDFGRKRGLGL
jgi:hypothetical protein